MIYYVSGSVSILEPGLAVIDCGGVGYGCRISAYTSAQLKLNTTARLFVTESIREDAHDLYGFSSKEEQRCFELLTAINGLGIGPQGFGGRTTCLGLAIEQMPTHVAGLPVAVNVSCHVSRRASAEL